MDVLSQLLLKTYDNGVGITYMSGTEYYTFKAAKVWATQHDYILPEEIEWVQNHLRDETSFWKIYHRCKSPILCFLYDNTKKVVYK